MYHEFLHNHQFCFFLAIDASRKWSATSKEKELKVCDWLKHTKDRIAAKQLEDNNREAKLEWSDE